MENEMVFSVSEFNEAVDRHLRLLGEVTVEGEISQYRISQGKWIYITIKDEQASVEVFGMTFRIRNSSSLEEGMKVKVTGVPGMYLKTGRFSLQATQIIPSGEGALKLAYEKLKVQLEKEGLFDPERKRRLPMFPQSVGLLTGKDSQAYNDFIKITNERIGGVKIYYYPVIVQGMSAVSSVISGIRYFNSLENKPDVLIVTRGGGSLEDLIAFNDERIVREVYGSNIPTVCAIGHEGDMSLAELAADLRASTPSNASELIFRHRDEVIREIHQYEHVLEESVFGLIYDYEDRVKSSVSSLDMSLEKSFVKIDRSIDAIYQLTKGFIERIEYFESNVVATGARLNQSIKSWIKLTSERVSHLEEKLKNLDPREVLKRGYSIMRDSSGAIVKSIKQINLQDTITSVLSDGLVESVVRNTKKGEL